MAICPYPLPKDIFPCYCFMNAALEVFVRCDLKEKKDINSMLLKLNIAFECKRQIKEIQLSFNGLPLNLSLSYKELGEFEMTRLKISDFLTNSMRIEGRMFNGSLLTLEEIFIGYDAFGSIPESAFRSNYNQPRSTITTGAFSMLHKLILLLDFF